MARTSLKHTGLIVKNSGVCTRSKVCLPLLTCSHRNLCAWLSDPCKEGVSDSYVTMIFDNSNEILLPL